MAKKDYTKYVKTPQETETDKIEAVEEPVAVEEVVEEIDETKPVVSGIVTNCSKLNVRVAPNANADVVCVVNASANIVINESESTDEFYKVCTATGAEGFCMKKFIKILS